jgi:hypothetical protein
MSNPVKFEDITTQPMEEAESSVQGLTVNPTGTALDGRKRIPKL